MGKQGIGAINSNPGSWESFENIVRQCQIHCSNVGFANIGGGNADTLVHLIVLGPLQICPPFFRNDKLLKKFLQIYDIINFITLLKITVLFERYRR